MIRDYRLDDEIAVRTIHAAQGFDYNLDLDDPLFLVRKVREVDGRVVGAMFLRLTAETYLLCEGSSESKGRSILELQPDVLREAFEKGLADVVCVVPPEISATFAPTLVKMGWSRDRDWPMWSRSTNCEMP